MKLTRTLCSIMAAVGLLGLGACDRMSALSELASGALAQITGSGPATNSPAPPSDSDLLAAASLDERAVFGVMSAPVDLQPLSLDEMLQTQSFFAVGSVIAMPKQEFVEPVLEPESFALIAEEAQDSPEIAAAMNTDTAPEPESAELPAGAPVTDIAPPEPTGGAGRAVTADGAPALRRPGALGPRPEVKAEARDKLRQQAEVRAPLALHDAVKDSGVGISPEKLKEARAIADQAMRANSQNAQAIGDAIARKDLRLRRHGLRATRCSINCSRSKRCRQRTRRRRRRARRSQWLARNVVVGADDRSRNTTRSHRLRPGERQGREGTPQVGPPRRWRAQTATRSN